MKNHRVTLKKKIFTI